MMAPQMPNSAKLSSRKLNWIICHGSGRAEWAVGAS